MSRVLFIQNGEQDGPGLFLRTLGELGIALEILPAWRGEPIPTHLENYSGLAIGGGHMSVYQSEEYPFLAAEQALLRSVREQGKPILGMCLGAQLMAQAFGGTVFANHHKEIGFHEIQFSAEAEQDLLWKGFTTPLRPVHWHGDTLALPPGAALLASSSLTANQLFRLGQNLYGFQFHLEIDLPVLTEMIQSDDGSLSLCGVDPQEFLRAGAHHLPLVEPIGRAVFTRWATLLN